MTDLVPVAGDQIVSQDESPGNAPARDRSTVRFPYNSLDQAVAVAEAVAGFGGEAEPQAVAGLLGYDSSSSAYRFRVHSANVFGLVVNPRGGNVALTDLGHSVVDPEERDAAKVTAFLTVPLYEALYRLFGGRALPGTDAGLEGAVAHAGVSRKQAAKARQIFVRSAEEAGFFKVAGRGRLIKPPTATLGDPEVVATSTVATTEALEGSEAGVLQDPVLAGLFRRMLPAEGQEFSAKDRRRFFRALAVNLDVIYGEPTDGGLDPDQLARLFVVREPVVS